MLNLSKSLFNKNLSKFFSTSKAARLNHLHIPAKNPTHEPYNLIVLHGLLGNATNFRGIVNNQKISSLANSYLLDLRNHGSSEHKNSMTLQEMAADVHSFLQENNIHKNVVIMGHSLGARVAMNFCLQFPQILTGAIIVDMIPHDYNSDPSFVINSTTRIMLEKLVKIDMDSGYKNITEQIRTAAGNKMVAEFVMTNLKKNEETGNYEWKCNLSVILKDYGNVLGGFENPGQDKFTGPLKIIFGDKSEYYSKDLMPKFKNVFPQFEENKHVTLIKDAGHWVHFAQPQAFIDEASQFLQTL